nr:hypothetical protein [Tanacetum cinerariifolium]
VAQGGLVALEAAAADGQVFGEVQVGDGAAAGAQQVLSGLVGAGVVVGGDGGRVEQAVYPIKLHDGQALLPQPVEVAHAARG